MAAGVGAALLFAAPAQADAIDGDWCREDGKRMSIRGPDIVTPGGKAMRGDYSRHCSLTGSRRARRTPARPWRSRC
jgi:hypothetical protein